MGNIEILHLVEIWWRLSPFPGSKIMAWCLLDAMLPPANGACTEIRDRNRFSIVWIARSSRISKGTFEPSTVMSECMCQLMEKYSENGLKFNANRSCCPKQVHHCAEMPTNLKRFCLDPIHALHSIKQTFIKSEKLSTENKKKFHADSRNRDKNRLN